MTISKPGYRTTTHTVTHQTAGGGGAAMAGNVLVGGIIGAAIDGNNGATQDLVPNPLHVTLELEAAAPAAADPAQQKLLRLRRQTEGRRLYTRRPGGETRLKS